MLTTVKCSYPRHVWNFGSALNYPPTFCPITVALTNGLDPESQPLVRYPLALSTALQESLRTRELCFVARDNPILAYP